jgi:hypothetical protein
VIAPEISGVVVITVTKHPVIVTINGTSTVIAGQSLLVAFNVKVVVPTGAAKGASTVIFF